MSQLTLGIDTFGDTTLGPDDGQFQSQAQTLRELVDQAVCAEQMGIDFIGLGEHHRDDFAISAPEVVLAAIAGQTERIKLGSAVTVLSTDDPVRVFQRFSTLNALSNGRAEPILGRGSFTESYALFGHDMRAYDLLFEEKLDLFARLLREDRVTWHGQTRPALENAKIYPPLDRPMTSWVGVGGSPESVLRVARHDLQLMLAVIGGDALRFRPLIDLYHRACAQHENVPRPIGIHSPGFVAQTDEAAREALWPHYERGFGRIGKERGWPPLTKERYVNDIEHGALIVGSPETVARKIARAITGLGLSRFDLKYANGPMPHGELMHTLELYGTKVIPRVRELVNDAPD